MGSVIKKRRKKIRKHKHRKMLKKQRHKKKPKPGKHVSTAKILDQRKNKKRAA